MTANGLPPPKPCFQGLYAGREFGKTIKNLQKFEMESGKSKMEMRGISGQLTWCRETVDSLDVDGGL